MNEIRWDKMVEDTKKFFTAPSELYQNFEKEGGYLEPIIYVILMTLIGEILIILFFSVFRLPYLAISMVFCFLFIPITIVGFFISTFILHLIWTALGSEESFETSLRCNASFSALFPAGILVSLIPFFGKWIGMFAYLFALYFYIIIASIYVHRIDETRARKVFLTIFVVLAFLRMANIVRWEIREKNTKRKTEEMIKKM
ncbi:MAG: YIP1 family protein, partial [Candidatus Omnitrophica bacterium]|nr:YIP1 family protein [Candidatus Omnitrophota bacterium]